MISCIPSLDGILITGRKSHSSEESSATILNVSCSFDKFEIVSFSDMVVINQPDIILNSNEQYEYT